MDRNMLHECLYTSPIGTLRIVADDIAIRSITLEERQKSVDVQIAPESFSKPTPLIDETIRQLDQYFSKTRTTFDLPLDPEGTVFQKQVWAALRNIPYGQTRTYKEIAQAIDCPHGYRAVGLANNRNPIIIVIPCHRVIGSNGSLIGYRGGLSVKEELLKLEGAL